MNLNRRRLYCTIIILMWGLMGSGVCQALQFYGLGGLPVLDHGELPGPRPESYARGISGDGSTIVGFSNTEESLHMDHYEAFRWTAADGMIGLDDSGAVLYSGAHGVSFDGSTVVGAYDRDDGHINAFYWTQDAGLQFLDSLPGYGYGSAIGISADGSLIVGFQADSPSIDDRQAVVWTDAGKQVLELGDLGGNQSQANSISADGSVIVGSSINASGRKEAFQWTQMDGMLGLGHLNGYESSSANGVSADGGTVVGHLSGTTGSEAFVWNESSGMIGLGDLAGGPRQSSANDVSADGSIVVGSSISDVGEEAFIWNAENGLQSIQSVLENDYASDLEGWILLSATGISDDGSVITGYGINPDGNQEAWMIDTNAVPISGNVWLMVTGVIGIAAMRLRRRKN